MVVCRAVIIICIQKLIGPAEFFGERVWWRRSLDGGGRLQASPRLGEPVGDLVAADAAVGLDLAEPDAVPREGRAARQDGAEHGHDHAPQEGPVPGAPPPQHGRHPRILRVPPDEEQGQQRIHIDVHLMIMLMLISMAMMS